jgi:tRNA A-37 threonylcarbamoyl transferase component Bud32/membrane-associated phospholipid phosphatase
MMGTASEFGVEAPERRVRIGPRGVIESGRRRRPSGKPPPLPRELGASGKIWIGALVGLVAILFFLIVFQVGGPLERGENAFLRWLAEWRTGGLTRVARFVNGLGADQTTRTIRIAAILALIAVRRWRHLLVFLAVILFVSWLNGKLAQFAPRAKPLGVRVIGDWEGSSFPSRPVAALSTALTGVLYTLTVPGRQRQLAKWIAWALLGVFVAARLYLALDHPTDVLFGLVLGAGIPLLAFRMFTPNAVFPVAYGSGRAAHLDVTGRRGQAIRDAVLDQLGLTVLDIKPFGLKGSGGSTPLRLLVSGEPDRHVFAKLYARTHLRADRWYKLGRTILYGTLEDEKAYNSVRRLVQYEDYVLRVMHDAGIPCAESYGFVEITPEREYLLVTEFLEGGTEISEVEVTDGVIDDALGTIRRLWDLGLAHRDIKPANILVRNGKIVLIDLAFGEIRPSPWRQAVDLANMMVVLGLGGDPDRVYERALLLFTPEEVGEAFAATRSVTMPSQSRNLLRRQRKEGRDVLARFRELAPKRRPISIQRWSVQRIGVTAMVVLGVLLALGLVLDNLRTGTL